MFSALATSQQGYVNVSSSKRLSSQLSMIFILFLLNSSQSSHHLFIFSPCFSLPLLSGGFLLDIFELTDLILSTSYSAGWPLGDFCCCFAFQIFQFSFFYLYFSHFSFSHFISSCVLLTVCYIVSLCSLNICTLKFFS